MNLGKLKISAPSADIPIMFGTGTLALLISSIPPVLWLGVMFGIANLVCAWGLKRKYSSAKAGQGSP